MGCLDQSSQFSLLSQFSSHSSTFLGDFLNLIFHTFFGFLLLTWLIISKNTADSVSFLFHFLLVLHGYSISSLMKLSFVKFLMLMFPSVLPASFSAYWFQVFLTLLEIFGSLHTYEESTYSYLKVKHWTAIWKLYIRRNSLTNGLVVVAEDSTKLCLDLRPTENEIINVCCFKMLNMWQFATQQINIIMFTQLSILLFM